MLFVITLRRLICFVITGMFIRYIVHCHVPNPVGTLRKFVHCAMYNVPTFARGGLQCTNVPTLRASVFQRFLSPFQGLWEELELFVHCPSRFGTLPCTMYQLLRRAHWAFSGLKGTPCAVGTLFASQCTMYQCTNVRTFARQALKCTNVRIFLSSSNTVTTGRVLFRFCTWCTLTKLK